MFRAVERRINSSLFRSAQTAKVRSLTSSLVLCVGLAAAIAVSTALLIADMHGRAIADVENNLTGMSAVLSDQAERALQAMELAQEAVIEEFREARVTDAAGYAAVAGRKSLHDTLRTRIASLPQVNAVTVIDHTGRLLNFSRYWPIPEVNISDRDYFQALSAQPDLQRFVSRPVRNRGDGAWTIYLARKVSAPDGSFLGLVLGAVELAYFENLYRQIAPADDYVVSIFRNDGVLLVRHPYREGTIGNVFLKAGPLVVAATNPNGGILRNVSPIDGKDRLLSARTLTRYPLILNISRTVEASLLPFYRQAAVIAAAAALVVCCLGGLILVFLRQARDQRRVARAETARAAAEERERGERDLRAQYACFGVALDNMIQGLCLFDADHRLVVMNARFAEIHAVPEPLQQQGVTAESIGRHIVSRQSAAASDTARLLPAPVPPGKAPTSQVCDLVDGRAVSIVRAPIPGGGWVCTHEDVTERRQNEARLRFLARHDALTGLPNRVLFEEVVERATAACAEQGGRIALLCLDLDGFKQINDLFGHPAGDGLLVEVARRLRGFEDAGCTAARLGGDEFALVIADAEAASSDGRAEDVARAVTAALAASFPQGSGRIEVGCSIGIARFPRDGRTYSQLLSAADMALAGAKRAGKGTYRFFESAMDAEARERHGIAADLRAALGSNQFELYFQPQYEVATNRVSGFEALLRWTHPDRGAVPPDRFIPIAEETGLILPLGEWVLREACREAAGWVRPLGIAVNLSTAQFRQADLPDLVRDILRETGLSPGRLELEVTESLFLESTTRSRHALDRLRELGVRISMDDFGTGYSSLLTLQSFPFDKLKIDRSFVSQIGVTEKGTAIVRAILALGASLDMPVIAEGIESEAQVAFLRQHRCAQMQGFLRGRPQPIARYDALVHAPEEEPVLQLRRA